LAIIRIGSTAPVWRCVCRLAEWSWPLGRQSTADARRIDSVKEKYFHPSTDSLCLVTEGRRVFLASSPLPTGGAVRPPLSPPGRECVNQPSPGPPLLPIFSGSACVSGVWCSCVCLKSIVDRPLAHALGTESRRRRPGVDDHVWPPSRRDFVRVKRALQRPPNEISPSGRGSGGSRLKSPVVRAARGPLTDGLCTLAIAPLRPQDGCSSVWLNLKAKRPAAVCSMSAAALERHV
jgi:hypothetical protein